VDTNRGIVGGIASISPAGRQDKRKGNVISVRRVIDYLCKPRYKHGSGCFLPYSDISLAVGERAATDLVDLGGWIISSALLL
jgi:hypothetical protein